MMNWWWTDDELMMNWWWTDDELMMNWCWTDDELMMNWWWTDDELMMNWWWTDYELMMNWWTGLVWSAKDYHRLPLTATDWLVLLHWTLKAISGDWILLLHISLTPPTTRAPLAVLIRQFRNSCDVLLCCLCTVQATLHQFEISADHCNHPDCSVQPPATDTRVRASKMRHSDNFDSRDASGNKTDIWSWNSMGI